MYARRFITLGLAIFVAAVSCTDGSAPLDPAHGDAISFALVPQLSVNGGAATQPLPITHFRITITNADETQILVGPVVVPANFNGVNLTVPTNRGPIKVLAELLNITNGVETVEFYVVSEPFTPAVTGANQVPPVTAQRGALESRAVTGISVSPASPAAVTEGETVQLSAATTGVTDARVFWSSSTPEVATVSETGLVSLLRDGTATITASAGSHSASVTVSARQRPAAIQVTPGTQQVASIGEEVAFTAVVVDPRGAPVPSASVSWTAGNASVVESLGDGRFRSRGNGTSPVTATLVGGTINGSAQVEVQQRPARVTVTPGSQLFTALGQRLGYTAAVVDARGTPVAGASVTWSSSAPSTVAVAADGTATAMAPGEAVITATAGAVSGTGTATVRQTVARLAVDPASATLDAVGATAQLNIAAFDANDRAIAQPTGIVWSSSRPETATVSPAGLVTAAGNGTARITASAGNAAAGADITVRQTVHQLAVTPSSVTLSAFGETVDIGVTAQDRNGASIASPEVAWSSSQPAVASVSAEGRITAQADGDAVITARAGDRTATVAVSVRQAVARVIVAPASVQLSSPGATATFSANAEDALGRAAGVDAPRTWSTSNPAVATVSSAGVVTAIGNGTATITASIGGVPGTATVAVALPTGPLPDLTVVSASLDRSYLRAGESASLAVTARSIGAAVAGTTAKVELFNAANDALVATYTLPVALPADTPRTASATITPTASWPAEVYARITMDPAGVVPESNETNNTLRYPTTGSVTVVPAGAQPTVTLTDQFVVVGVTGHQLTATVRDPAGNVVSVPVVWSTSDATVATVDGNGFVTGGSNGLAQITAAATVDGNTAQDVAAVQVGTIERPAAATIMWVGQSSPTRSWGISENWDAGRVPTASDVVFIPSCDYSISSCYGPRLDGSVTVAGVYSSHTDLYSDVAVLPTLMKSRAEREPRPADWRERGPRVRERPDRAIRVSPRDMVRARLAETSTTTEWYYDYYSSIDLRGHTLTVTGDIPYWIPIGSPLGGNLRVTGTAVTVTADVIAHLEISGSVSDQSSMYVDGTTLISGTFRGHLYGTEAIDVTGTAHVSSYLDTDGVLTVTGTLTVPDGCIYAGAGFVLDSPSTTVVSDYGCIGVNSGLSTVRSPLHFTTSADGWFDGGLTLDGSAADLVIDDGYVGVGDYFYDEFCQCSQVGNLRLENGATLSITHPYGYMNVYADAFFNGASTAGLLTTGEIYFYGDLHVGGPDPLAFAPSGDHITGFGGACNNGHEISFAVPGRDGNGSHFNRLNLGYTSAVTLLTPVFVDADMDASSYTHVSGTDISVDGSLWIYDGELWDITRTYVGGDYLEVDVGELTTDLTIGGTLSLSNLVINGDLTVTGPVALSIVYGNQVNVHGQVRIENNAHLEIGLATLVASSFATASGGTLELSSEQALLAIEGDATFGGGPTTAQLATGAITVGGNFSVTNAGAFHATDAAQLSLNGTAVQQISVVSPGSSETQSSIGNLILANSAGYVLGSNLYLSGTLSNTQPGTVTGTCGTACVIDAFSSTVTGVSFTNATVTTRQTAGMIGGNRPIPR